MGVKRLSYGLVIMFILSGTANAQRLSVSVNSANVRIGPGTTYDIAWENLDKNYPLLVLDQKDGWYYIRDYEDDVGWIHESTVSAQDSVITKKDNCNVRSGPGTGTPVVFVVNNGVPFKVLKREGQWINIQHSDGDSGWVHEALVW
ncbi:MAG: SH3 domain-containing protein [Proteobacteria bacterium]|nr:SH3 domain-containing protein [Pseudomonadota bacterium]